MCSRRRIAALASLALVFGAASAGAFTIDFTSPRFNPAFLPVLPVTVGGTTYDFRLAGIPGGLVVGIAPGPSQTLTWSPSDGYGVSGGNSGLIDGQDSLVIAFSEPVVFHSFTVSDLYGKPLDLSGLPPVVQSVFLSLGGLAELGGPACPTFSATFPLWCEGGFVSGDGRGPIPFVGSAADGMWQKAFPQTYVSSLVFSAAGPATYEFAPQLPLLAWQALGLPPGTRFPVTVQASDFGLAAVELPEPGDALLLGPGLAVLALAQRRRRRGDAKGSSPVGSSSAAG